MRLLRIYLLTLSDLGEVTAELFADLDAFLPRWGAIKDVSESKALIHIGFSRPPDTSIRKLFDGRKNGLLFTNPAKTVLTNLITVNGLAIASIEGDSVYAFGSSSLIAPPAGHTSTQTTQVNLAPPQPQPKELLIIPDWVVRGNSFTWFKDFAVQYPDIAKLATSIGIVNDISYQTYEIQLEGSVRLQLAKHRIEFLLPLLKLTQIQDYCKVIPPWGLEIPIEKLNFGVRTSNRLAILGIKVLGDFSRFTNEVLLKAPGFGMNSLTEVRTELSAQLDFFVHQQRSSQDIKKSIADNASLNTEDSGDEDDDEDDVRDLPNHLYFSDNLIDLLNEVILKIKPIWIPTVRMRFGMDERTMTLQEVAEKTGVTRERVRQIVAKSRSQIANLVGLPNQIKSHLDKAREGLVIPLQVENLPNYDEWFAGFDQKPWLFDALLTEFNVGMYRVHKYNGLNIVTIGESGFIDDLVRDVKAYAKNSIGSSITKADIKKRVSELVSASSPELIEFIFSEATRNAKFSPDTDEGLLISFGQGVDTFVTMVLDRADSPLHVDEVAKRIVEETKLPVDIRRVRNACSAQAYLFGRSTFGFRKHLNLTDTEINEIAEDVMQFFITEPEPRQKHTHQILSQLPDLQTEYPEPLNQYTLGICMDLSGKFSYLGRMVFTLAGDSSGNATKRIEFSQFIEAVLEGSPTPLHKDEIIKRITTERGLSQFRQIFQFGRLVKVAKNVWALMDKHLHLSNQEYSDIVAEIVQVISSKGHGLTQGELVDMLGQDSASSKFFDNPFILESLATKSKKCKKIDDFLYLSEWDDCRRMTFAGAMQKVVDEFPPEGLPIREIIDKVSALYDQPFSRDYVNPVLKDCGASYDEESGNWRLTEEIPE